MRGRLVVALLLCCSACGEEDAAASPAAPWPRWALEHWVWEDESTQESALALVHDYLERDVPVSAIIIDSPWATGYNTFEWDLARFPDPQAMIDELHGLGVRVFLWIVPAINVDVPELYAYAAERRFFMQTSAGAGPAVVHWWKGNGSLIDLFNPEALAWWHTLVDKALAYGIDGWKTDGLDYSQILAPYSPGAGRAVRRPEYSRAYYEDFFHYTREQLGDDRLITSRPVDNYGTGIGGADAAFAPVEITWAGWVGDQDATFAGLRAALNNMYHSAAYGYVAFGSDIGGYREDGQLAPHGRDKELFIRWAQLGAFSPVMENGGGGEHRPWMFDLETLDIYRRFVKLHHALVPYLMEQGGAAFAQGRSLMRFLEPEIAWEEARYPFMLGDDVFVQPVLEASSTPGQASTVAVSFPEEGAVWEYLFDRARSFAGGSAESLTVPLGEYPAFVRRRSALARALP